MTLPAGPWSRGFRPAGDETEITKTRPVVRGLVQGDTLDSMEIERICLLPLADPGPIPSDVLGELVATLERGKAVVLCGTHEEAVDVASELIADMVGGEYA
jgi:hypothetical protein